MIPVAGLQENKSGSVLGAEREKATLGPGISGGECWSASVLGVVFPWAVWGRG